jgi:hypothetical protein
LDVDDNGADTGVWLSYLVGSQMQPPIIPTVESPTDSSYFEIEDEEPKNPNIERTVVPEGLFDVF